MQVQRLKLVIYAYLLYENVDGDKIMYVEKFYYSAANTNQPEHIEDQAELYFQRFKALKDQADAQGLNLLQLKLNMDRLFSEIGYGIDNKKISPWQIDRLLSSEEFSEFFAGVFSPENAKTSIEQINAEIAHEQLGTFIALIQRQRTYSRAVDVPASDDSGEKKVLSFPAPIGEG